MATADERSNSINISDAEKCAYDILEELYKNPECGLVIGNRLMSRYTSAPRRDVFDKMTKIIKSRKDSVKHDAIRDFISVQNSDVTANVAEKHVISLLNLAIVSSPDFGRIVAAELFVDFVMSRKEKKLKSEIVYLSDENIRSISLNVENMGSILTDALSVANKNGIVNKVFLSKWSRALFPHLVKKTKTVGLTAVEAIQIMDILSSLRLSEIPDELLLSCFRIIIIAGSEASGAFFNTPLGEVTSEMYISRKQIEEGLSTTAMDYSSDERDKPEKYTDERNIIPESLGKDQKELLNLMMNYFNSQNHDIYELQISNKKRIEELENIISAANRSHESLIEKYDGLKRRNETLELENSDLENRIMKLEDELSTTVSDRDTWKREAELREHQTDSRLTIMDEKQADSLRTLLARPTSKLRDIVITILENQGSEKKIRILAAAFDSLHEKLLQVMKLPDDRRIPRNLIFTSTDDNGGRDKNGN